MQLRVEFRTRTEAVIRVDNNSWVANKVVVGPRRRWMVADRIDWPGTTDSRGQRGFATFEDLLTAIETRTR